MEKEKEEAILKTKTLFVQNLPFTATNEQLETLLSDFGPLKKCFVVSDKNKNGLCKGVGYATFASEDDAVSALKKSVQLGGRRLSLSLANCKARKLKEEKKKQMKDELTEDPITDSFAAFENDSESTKESKATAASDKTSKQAAARTVIVNAIKSESEITKMAGNHKRIRNLNFGVAADGEKFVSILYRGKRDALGAIRRFLGLKMKAKLLDAKSREKLSTKANPKNCRLIVRNLPFKCENDHLQKVFCEFGEIVEVDIPKREDGKKRGFGIVQFQRIEDAGKAVEDMNGKDILGRPVAVDWALPKSKYKDLGEQTELRESEKGTKLKVKKKAADKTKHQRKSKADDEEEEEGDDEDDDELEESDEDDDDELEEADEDEEENDDAMETSAEWNLDDSIETSSSEEGDDDDDDSDEAEGEPNDDTTDDDDDDDDDDNEPENKARQKKLNSGLKPKESEIEKTKRREPKPDVDQGRTVFIRNLSFDSMEEDLEELMEEQFGDVRYCRIVMDKSMEHSKGTAFVQFKTKEQAEECISTASSSADGIVLDGRKLLVSLALPKSKADDLKQPQNKEKTDKRNLHLVRVGLIRPGTQEASGLSTSDLQKRMKVEAITRQKLKNPNIFVSSTRLCIRNIPVSVDDSALSKTFRKASGNPKAKITECRIMRDLQRVGGNGLGKSRGYGFVNFENHEDALNALQATNNNPEIYGESRRLIVEFSLENKAALLAKQRRLERSQKKDVPQKKKVSTKFKPEIVMPEGNQKKGLPSHWGPKIRHKTRPEMKKVKRQKPNFSDEQQMSVSKKKRKSKKRSAEITDNLDKLIENYRTKFSNA